MPSPSHTLAPSGGVAFSNSIFVIQVDERVLKPGHKAEDTEAVLVKQGGPTDLNSVMISTPTKNYATLEDYLDDNAVAPIKGTWWGGWMFVKVLVKTMKLYNSGWINGQAFKDGTEPSTPPTYMPTPPPAPRYEIGAAHLATFTIRDDERMAPAAPSTLRTAKLTFSSLDDHYIIEGQGQLHYGNIDQWRSGIGISATEEDIAKAREKNGSPWGHIHVLVDGRWIPGLDFIAMRDTPTPN